MKVQDVMTQAPACCTPEDDVFVAAQIMHRFDVGIVPVTDKVNAHAKLVGVVTDRDLCLKALGSGKDPATFTVNDCMSTHLTVCTPLESIEVILKRMGRAKVRRLPVVDRNLDVIGIISLDDIVRLKAAKDSDIAKAMTAICTPGKVTRQPGRTAA